MSNGSVDPRLNCASRICCDPPEGFRATTEILMDLGCPDRATALCMAEKMEILGITFLPVALAEVIAEIAQHPGKRARGSKGSKDSKDSKQDG